MFKLFRPALTGAPQEFFNLGGFPGFITLKLEFAAAPSAGTVTIEGQRAGSLLWLPILGGTDAPVNGAPVMLAADGGYVGFRLTFTGLVGGDTPILAIVGNQTVSLPSWMMTDEGFGNAARLRVDNGQTGFFDRRMWSLGYEFASTNPIAGTPLVFKLVIPVNFIVHAHSLAVDAGGVTLRTYSAAQGVDGGGFATPRPLASENSMTEEEAYAFQAVMTSGGTFTPNVGAVPITSLRVRTAGATAQQSSVGLGAVSEKGRPAGTYYAVLQRMNGVNGDCTGKYDLVVEERNS